MGEKPATNPGLAEGATEGLLQNDPKRSSSDDPIKNAEKGVAKDTKSGAKNGTGGDVLSMVKPSIVLGTVTEDADLFSAAGGGDVAGTIAKGTEVEIVSDKGYKWYYVKDSGAGLTGWLSPDYLDIPSDPPTNQSRMARGELEAYVNEVGLASDTSYLVWVDIDRQLTHVFCGQKGKWELSETLECSTGENISPSLRGEFALGERGEWFYNPTFASGGKYWVRYSGAYLFHSVAMNEDGTVQDPTVGERASAGCIRLPLDGAKWFYETVPFGTKAFIY